RRRRLARLRTRRQGLWEKNFFVRHHRVRDRFAARDGRYAKLPRLLLRGDLLALDDGGRSRSMPTTVAISSRWPKTTTRRLVLTTSPAACRQMVSRSSAIRGSAAPSSIVSSAMPPHRALNKLLESGKEPVVVVALRIIGADPRSLDEATE